jgi:hypothetical protein
MLYQMSHQEYVLGALDFIMVSLYGEARQFRREHVLAMDTYEIIQLLIELKTKLRNLDIEPIKRNTAMKICTEVIFDLCEFSLYPTKYN